MLKYLLILFFSFVCSVYAFGQEIKMPRGNNSSPDSGEKDESHQHEEENQVESKIQVWKLVDSFSRNDSVVLDSGTINFHIYNPIFQNSISNNYLGYFGSPYESNIFFKRKSDVNDFYFLKNLSAYRLKSNDVKYYNTTTPFAVLKYTQGNQGADKAEQTFKAFYTQNIDSTINIGFDFNVFANESKYISQEIAHKYFNIFLSRNTERHHGYLTFVNGNNNLVENGGVPDDVFERGFRNPVDMPVNLTSAIETENKSFSLFTSHEYFMGQLPFLESKPDSVIADSLKPAFKPAYSIHYYADYSNYKRFVSENTMNTEFFDTTLISTSGHVDSVFFRTFNHSLQLNAFENEDRKFTFGKRAFIENEVVRAEYPLADGRRSYSYGNVYLGGEIYRSKSDFWIWRAGARFAVLGRNLGDAKIEGAIEKPFIFKNDTTRLKIEGWYRDFSPDIFQEHWFSNHFAWDNEFKKQHEVFVKSKFDYPDYNASAGFNYGLFGNYLYNNTQAMPDQYTGEISVVSANVQKDFNFWRFGWSNKAVWQAVSGNPALRLPTWSFYSSFYYSHYLFKVMKVQLGAEIYYHSKFKANAYEPSTGQFYVQNEMNTGGYPVVNLFANAKLKRTSAFAQLVHASSFFNLGEYFSAYQYPLETMAFRFGFYWTFYD